MSDAADPTLVIDGCAIATVDATGTEYRDGHIVVRGNRIEAVGGGLHPRRPGPPASTAGGACSRPVWSIPTTTSTSG